jgi:hypothetical protein
MINMISYKRTLLCYFQCHCIRSSGDLVPATWKWCSFSIRCGTSSLFCCDFFTENLLIRNKDYVPTAFYSALLSSSSAELTQLSSLCWMKYIPMRPLSLIFHSLWKIIIAYPLYSFFFTLNHNVKLIQFMNKLRWTAPSLVACDVCKYDS